MLKRLSFDRHEILLPTQNKPSCIGASNTENVNVTLIVVICAVESIHERRSDNEQYLSYSKVHATFAVNT